MMGSENEDAYMVVTTCHTCDDIFFSRQTWTAANNYNLNYADILTVGQQQLKKFKLYEVAFYGNLLVKTLVKKS